MRVLHVVVMLRTYVRTYLCHVCMSGCCDSCLFVWFFNQEYEQGGHRTQWPLFLIFVDFLIFDFDFLTPFVVCFLFLLFLFLLFLLTFLGYPLR